MKTALEEMVAMERRWRAEDRELSQRLRENEVLLAKCNAAIAAVTAGSQFLHQAQMAEAMLAMAEAPACSPAQRLAAGKRYA